MRLRYFLFSQLVVCVISACAGPSNSMKRKALSRTEAYVISEQLTEAIESKYSLLKHKRVNRYVESLGQSLLLDQVDMPPLAYEFRVLKTNDIVTYSTPSGVIYVSLGALRASQIEGQFVAALAHELAHQRASHGVIMWQQRLNNMRMDPTYVLPDKADWAQHLEGQAGLFFLGEGKEREADQLALLIMYRAQFDPRAFLSWLEILKDVSRDDPKRLEAFFSTHPPILDRISWAKLETQRLPPVRESRLSSKSFDGIQALLKRTAKQSKTRRLIEPPDDIEDSPEQP